MNFHTIYKMQKQHLSIFSYIVQDTYERFESIYNYLKLPFVFLKVFTYLNLLKNITFFIFSSIPEYFVKCSKLLNYIP